MKISTFFILSFSFLLNSLIHAQFTVGVRTSYVNATEHFGDVFIIEDAQTHINGLQVSGLLYMPVGKILQVGIEPGYVQRGAACYPGSFFFLFDTKFRLNYLEIPLMASAHIPLFKGKLSLVGKAGYGGSMMISAMRSQKEFFGDEPAERDNPKIKDSNMLNRWDHGAYTGLGLQVKVGQHQLFLESQYYAAMTDAFKRSTSKNRSIQVGMGYLVSL